MASTLPHESFSDVATSANRSLTTARSSTAQRALSSRALVAPRSLLRSSIEDDMMPYVSRSNSRVVCRACRNSASMRGKSPPACASAACGNGTSGVFGSTGLRSRPDFVGGDDDACVAAGAMVGTSDTTGALNANSVLGVFCTCLSCASLPRSSPSLASSLESEASSSSAAIPAISRALPPPSLPPLASPSVPRPPFKPRILPPAVSTTRSATSGMGRASEHTDGRPETEPMMYARSNPSDVRIHARGKPWRSSA